MRDKYSDQLMKEYNKKDGLMKSRELIAKYYNKFKQLEKESLEEYNKKWQKGI